MDVFNVLELLGGLALFLYGMTMLSSGLEKVSGGRLEATLEKLTSNIFKSILVGALVTGAIQSSSATTVIVVGLVNAKQLKLKQAIGIIMGANIGTTVTAHILRLTDIQSTSFFINLLKPSSFTPVLLVIGVLLVVTSKKSSRRNIGTILIGFGILFTGMFSMEAAVSPLKDMPAIADLFSKFSNPILGVLTGAGVTAVIQSSSASVGILQALSSTGAITFAAAFPIIMGQNIGTCITPVLASIGASKNAKRTAFIHVAFNVIGTILFLIGIYAFQYFVGFPFWNDAIDKGGIATFHTIFNLTITVLLIPFAGLLEKLANRCIRDKQGDSTEEDNVALSLDERFFVSPTLALTHAKEAVELMATLSRKNVKQSFALLFQFDRKSYERIRETENTIDKLQSKVESYLIKITEKTLSESESIALSEMLQLTNEFERIGDHADNICDCAFTMQDKGIIFSGAGKNELTTVFEAVEEILDLSVNAYKNDEFEVSYTVEPLEEVIDMLVETVKQRHVERLKQGKCSIETSFSFNEVLTSMERIADHCSNVGIHLLGYHSPDKNLDRHEYLREMQKSKNSVYTENFDAFDKKYFGAINKQ